METDSRWRWTCRSPFHPHFNRPSRIHIEYLLSVPHSRHCHWVRCRPGHRFLLLVSLLTQDATSATRARDPQDSAVHRMFVFFGLGLHTTILSQLWPRFYARRPCGSHDTLALSVLTACFASTLRDYVACLTCHYTTLHGLQHADYARWPPSPTDVVCPELLCRTTHLSSNNVNCCFADFPSISSNRRNAA